MNPLLTDDAVAALPIHDGRAELLEEIVRSPVLDERPAPRRTRGDRPTIGIRRAWVAPAAAAVAILLLVIGVGWTADHVLGESAPRPVATQPPHTDAFRVVLAAPGWTVSGVQQGDDLGGIAYRNGVTTLKLDWYPADGFDERLAHRRDEAGSAGTAVEIAGLSGWMWSSAANDHTAIRPVEDGHFLEVRGSGMDATAFAALLPQLTMVDAAGFDAALPADYAHDATRGTRVDRLLDGIAQHAQPLLPDGVDRSWVTSDQSDPVQLGTEVADRVACAWIARYADARSAGDEAGAQQAAEVMSTSRRWPVLRQIQAESDEPEWIWWAADEMAAGRVPQGWKPSCAGHLP